MNSPEVSQKEYVQPDPETFTAWREGDPGAGALIVDAYSDYVADQADRAWFDLTAEGGVVEIADLMQDGREKVLTDAAISYNPSRGSFLSFIKRRVPKHIVGERVGHGGAMYLARGAVTGRFLRFKKAEVSEPAQSDLRVAKLLGITIEAPEGSSCIPATPTQPWSVQGFRVSMAVNEAESLDRLEEENPRRWEVVTPVAERDLTQSVEDQVLHKVEVRKLVRKAFTPGPEATEREKASLAEQRMVVALRFGLIDGVPRTLKEVGRKFSISHTMVAKIEKKALQLLREVAGIAD